MEYLEGEKGRSYYEDHIGQLRGIRSELLSIAESLRYLAGSVKDLRAEAAAQGDKEALSTRASAVRQMQR